MNPKILQLFYILFFIFILIILHNQSLFRSMLITPLGRLLLIFILILSICLHKILGFVLVNIYIYLYSKTNLEGLTSNTHSIIAQQKVLHQPPSQQLSQIQQQQQLAENINQLDNNLNKDDKKITNLDLKKSDYEYNMLDLINIQNVVRPKNSNTLIYSPNFLKDSKINPFNS